MDIVAVLKNYDQTKITIGVLGGHSALDVCAGAKKLGFRTLVVAEKNRQQTYSKYYRTRPEFAGSSKEKGVVDEVIVVDKFADIVKPEIQEQLRSMNTIFIHNRYFWVYCNFPEIETAFNVPILGNRTYVKYEERDASPNQYEILAQAGIRTPKILRPGGTKLSETELRKLLDEHFVSNKGGPLIIKAHEALRSYERAFFVINREQDYFQISEEMIKNGSTTAEIVETATIEEFILGAQVNFNFFYSPLTEELELMGTDMRRQTNLDGFLRLNAKQQSQLLDSGFKPTMVETGHVACTIKESLIEKAYEIGEKFVHTTKELLAPGIIGPFALQGAVDSLSGREELVIFDVSMRIPGSPGTRFTPYTGYLYGENYSYGDRIASEVALAIKLGKLDKLVS
ncbi:DUF1297 domain-containing protein [Candidatus Gracilibacteria bacterium]|jgi:5-formaminoimidazole-4-carboxamide-1-(beta)-D-ribofuranosyl 5'-monophosphate synthetase|nr:DUF1297 domain-containing protein [Candidatus Gracilibacteria bacterium]